MKRKIFSYILVMVIAFALVGCGQAPQEDANKNEINKTESS